MRSTGARVIGTVAVSARGSRPPAPTRIPAGRPLFSRNRDHKLIINASKACSQSEPKPPATATYRRTSCEPSGRRSRRAPARSRMPAGSSVGTAAPATCPPPAEAPEILALSSRSCRACPRLAAAGASSRSTSLLSIVPADHDPRMRGLVVRAVPRTRAPTRRPLLTKDRPNPAGRSSPPAGLRRWCQRRRATHDRHSG